MASEYSLFITETLYSIPEELVAAAVPKAEIETADLQAAIVQLVEDEPVNHQSETKTVGFGSQGYQISSTQPCRTILITSIDPGLFDEIPEFGFLPKMLKAVGEDAGKVCYLNLAPDTSDLSELQLIRNYQFMLVFLSQEHPFAKRLKLEPYQLKDFKGMQTVLANELHVVENDKQHKTSLWGALQNMYLNK